MWIQNRWCIWLNWPHPISKVPFAVWKSRCFNGPQTNMKAIIDIYNFNWKAYQHLQTANVFPITGLSIGAVETSVLGFHFSVWFTLTLTFCFYMALLFVVVSSATSSKRGCWSFLLRTISTIREKSSPWLREMQISLLESFSFLNMWMYLMCFL